MKNWLGSKDWWKAPILQGEENDYGDYDYLIEEVPKSYCPWSSSQAILENSQRQ